MKKIKSILQEDMEHCYLCGKNASFEPLDWHHIFGGANKTHSEEYGLMVLLHHRSCHIFGKDSVHQNAETMKMLKAEAQRKAMQVYGMSIDEFIKIFGRNYL